MSMVNIFVNMTENLGIVMAEEHLKGFPMIYFQINDFKILYKGNTCKIHQYFFCVCL